VLLASASRQSQYAFYNADSALECVLKQDSYVPSGQTPRFDYTNGPTIGNFTCEGQNINYNYPGVVSGNRTTTFNIPCATGNYNATVTLVKTLAGATSFYANGFNTCNTSDPYRVERGIKAYY
jgi:hypothetical protein